MRKFFWACLAQRWLEQGLSFEVALNRTSEDILALGDLFSTRLLALEEEDPTEIAVA